MAAPEVGAHLPVKPRDGVSVSEALETTRRLHNGLLLPKALSSRLEHKRPHFSSNCTHYIYTKQDFSLNHIKISQMWKNYGVGFTLAALSLSSKRRVTKSSKRCEPEVCRVLEGRP